MKIGWVDEEHIDGVLHTCSPTLIRPPFCNEKCPLQEGGLS